MKTARTALALWLLVAGRIAAGEPQPAQRSLGLLSRAAPRTNPDVQTVAARVRDPSYVLAGLRKFYEETANPDGSFQNGIDPDYVGMSDSAYSDMAAVTYACTIHKTFGWKLPHEEKTIAWLQSRQREDGSFFNVAGTVDPASAQGKTYNTTQGLVALHALGQKPKHNPLPIFEEILKADYKQLPAFSTSFFPLAYLCYGQPIPEKADRGIRALMVQDETGYTNDHIAATFHASHYYRLVGDETPKSHEMVERILRDQQPDGSWLMNKPSRDRHATFDAVFTLLHEGGDREDVKAAIDRAAKWALSCRNDDGGFGHYPGSTSDADAIYFNVGTLVMAGYLKPVDPLPKDPHLLSWGHLMPAKHAKPRGLKFARHFEGWVSDVTFCADGAKLATATSDGTISLFDNAGEPIGRVNREQDVRGVASAVALSPDGRWLACGNYDEKVRIVSVTGDAPEVVYDHDGAILDIAFSPSGKLLASAGVDRKIRLCDFGEAEFGLKANLVDHKSWVNAIAFDPAEKWLASGSSDGTVKIWSLETHKVLKTLVATNAEVYAIAVSPDGQRIAAGIRYGKLRTWNTETWKEELDFAAHDADIFAVAFSPDSTLIATGNGDWNRAGAVHLWNSGTGQPAGKLQHTGEVLSLAWSQNNLLAAGAGDKTLRVWDMSIALTPE
jgi:geranylgeranyl transferase type-2 subunit beta